MSISMSKSSKMPCRSWSLPALTTCPGARTKNGNLVPACAGCYATTGNYRYPNVIEPRKNNRLDWKRSDWVQDMISELDNDRYFRWFDSGDIYHVDLAKKIYSVMVSTPWVKHWLPTRSHKIPKIKVWLDLMQELPNVMVRYSSDSVNGEYGPEHGSTIIPSIDTVTDATICRAYEQDKKCMSCRACWDKNIKVIAYPAHGKKMLSNIKKAA